MSIWTRLWGTGEAREAVQPAGPPSFEMLEPRLLLDGNLADLLPPVMGGEPAPQDAIHVDLGQQNVESQADPGSVLTIDLASGDEMGQPAPALMASETLPPETHRSPEEAEGQQVVELFGLSPALFVENQGQWSDPAVRYVHDGTGFDVAMTDTGVQFRGTAPDGHFLQFLASFVGANAVRPVGLERSGSLFNYHQGDQANWRQNVPAYAAVVYEGLYQGIDLRVQGLRSHLKYEFHVAPGAGDAFVMKLGGAGSHVWSTYLGGTSSDNHGGLAVDGTGNVYAAGGTTSANWVSGGFDTTYNGGPDDGDAFVLKLTDTGAHVWSTYLGGTGSDEAHGVAVEGAYGVYVACDTNSADLAGSGFDTTYNGGQDGFVVKITDSASPSPVYRFWSDKFHGHFYTISAAERDHVIATWPEDWTYEAPAYNAFASGRQPAGTIPIYRFWSGTFQGHFYTASPSERDHVIATWPQDWTYEGVAYYAYANEQHPTGILPVYRFWSPTFRHHFYTISLTERDTVITQWPKDWTYEGEAWYAYTT